MSFVQFITFYTLILKDLFEIIFFSVMFYWWSLWLKQDTQKPLLLYFYLYCSLWGVSYLFDLETILLVMQRGTPIVLLLFVILHQRTLQRNFISLFKVKPAQQAKSNWLHELIRSCLQTDCDLFFIIEHTTSIKELISIKIPMQTPITSTLLTLLYHSPDFDHERCLLLNTDGLLLGINVQWKKPLALTNLNENIFEKSSYYLHDTDGFLLHFDHTKRTFAIIAQQQLYEGLTTEQVMQSLEKYLQSKQTSQGTDYAHVYMQADQQQPHD